MISEQKKAEYKKMLGTLQGQLEAELKQLQNPIEMGDEIDAFDTEADEAEEFSANVGMAQAVAQRHEAVVSALNKIERGGYGVCESCSQDIEAEVLDVNPESKWCKGCKAKTQ